MELQNKNLVDLGYLQSEPMLTNREKEILVHIARGLTNKQISKQLMLSPSTIRNHISRLFTKLNISRRTQATAIAIYNGFLKQQENGILPC